jgi:hypothetical protein
MAEVTGKTSEEIDELLGEMVVSGRAQSGNLILVKSNGEEILGGYIGGSTGGGGTPTDPGPGENALNYENAAPNTLFVIFRDQLTGDWPGQRPSARADIYFDVTGVEPSPSWLLPNDRRSIPMPEGGDLIYASDLMMDFSGGGTYDGLTYDTSLPGSLFVVYKDPVNGWPTSRPSARTDIIFELVGTGTLPTWMINRDRRIIPKTP